MYWFYLDIDRPVVSEKFIIVEDKKNVRIQCDVDGYPEPNVVWRKDGNVLSATKHLSVMNVSAKDSGSYECIASNVVGYATNSTTLHVRCKTIFILFCSANFSCGLFVLCMIF